MRCGQIDLLGDCHKADLARAKTLQQGDLLGGISAQPVRPNNDNRTDAGATRFQQMGYPPPSRTLAQELRAAHTLVSDDLDQLGVLSGTSGLDPPLLSVQGHALRGLLCGAHPAVADNSERPGRRRFMI
jgi:hypothetical protein